MSIYTHVPHPHIERRKENGPPTLAEAAGVGQGGRLARFNARAALRVTSVVGTMWCAYGFALLALVALPTAIKDGSPTVLVNWVSSNFLQLVLLPIIIVGQNVLAQASENRAQATYNDAEAVLHEALQIQAHLEAQDAILERLIAGVSAIPAAKKAFAAGDIV